MQHPPHRRKKEQLEDWMPKFSFVKVGKGLGEEERKPSSWLQRSRWEGLKPHSSSKREKEQRISQAGSDKASKGLLAQ